MQSHYNISVMKGGEQDWEKDKREENCTVAVSRWSARREGRVNGSLTAAHHAAVKFPCVSLSAKFWLERRQGDDDLVSASQFITPGNAHRSAPILNVMRSTIAWMVGGGCVMLADFSL
jgi:hypothetical protein